jgi:hypothetical protein
MPSIFGFMPKSSLVCWKPCPREAAQWTGGLASRQVVERRFDVMISAMVRQILPSSCSFFALMHVRETFHVMIVCFLSS